MLKIDESCELGYDRKVVGLGEVSDEKSCVAEDESEACYGNWDILVADCGRRNGEIDLRQS